MTINITVLLRVKDRKQKKKRHYGSSLKSLEYELHARVLKLWMFPPNLAPYRHESYHNWITHYLLPHSRDFEKKERPAARVLYCARTVLAQCGTVIQVPRREQATDLPSPNPSRSLSSHRQLIHSASCTSVSPFIASNP